MIKKYIKRVIALGIIATSMLTINPIEVSAEWRQDSNGWWYTEGNSWVTGWENINGTWYYFYSDGYMAKDTMIDGYYLNSSGAWIKNQYYNSTPQMLANVLHISPKYVHYDNGNLIMEAYVYNGFYHDVYNIGNVNLNVSNAKEVIAQAEFEPLTGLTIPANSYKVWTFTFQSKYVKVQDADLSYLDVKYHIDNNY